ncbi:MAG: hypothetical protein CM1200mP6_07660 [Anaerolineaceae bacterium]|nr:MAG: hypothetical protein CM1200mP6_07660 [Anaerolineaceae bacterium]
MISDIHTITHYSDSPRKGNEVAIRVPNINTPELTLVRGNKQITLEKESSVFTALAPTRTELHRLQSTEGYIQSREYLDTYSKHMSTAPNVIQPCPSSVA